MDTTSYTPFEISQLQHDIRSFDHPSIGKKEKVRDVSDVELSDRLPQIPAYLDRLKAFSDSLWLEIRSKLQEKGRRELSEYRRQLQILVYHLAWAATDPANDGKLVMPFHTTKYGKGSGNREGLSHNRLMRLVELLTPFPPDDTGLPRGDRWHRYGGYAALDNSHGRASQLCAHPRFLDELARAGLLPCPKPTDVLKPTSKLGIVRIRPASEGDDETEQERDQKRLGRKPTDAEAKLDILNTLIKDAAPRVQLRSYDDYLLSRRKNETTGRTASVINDRKHRFYRLFNDQDGNGGRIWGSFLQRLRGQLRSQILMHDEPVCELDYASMQVALAYSLEGLPAPDLTDCYLVPGIDPSYRDLAKLAFTISVGCDKETNPIAALRFRARKAEWPDLTWKQAGEAYDAFWSYHAGIMRFRCTASWRELQYQESEIALNVIGQFVDQRRPIIPIHDGFVVQKRYENELRLAMEKAVEHLSARPKIKPN